eukprot:6885740-Lingulodinium_polyedra.AAC.1
MMCSCWREASTEDAPKRCQCASCSAVELDVISSLQVPDCKSDLLEHMGCSGMTVMAEDHRGAPFQRQTGGAT